MLDGASLEKATALLDKEVLIEPPCSEVVPGLDIS